MSVAVDGVYGRKVKYNKTPFKGKNNVQWIYGTMHQWVNGDSMGGRPSALIELETGHMVLVDYTQVIFIKEEENQ